VLLALLVLGLSPLSVAQEPATYRTPSAPLAALVDAPSSPLALLSPDRRQLVLLERAEAPSIAELAQPELRLAGLRINPATNGPSRALTYTGLVLKPVDGSAERRVSGLPEGARIAHYEWAPDGAHLAFTLLREKGVELWVAEIATAQAKRLTPPIINATFGDPMGWLDASTLLACRVPEGRGPAPLPPRVPAGPIVQETGGRRAPDRTYDGLLASPHDEALFDYYFTSQLVQVSLNGGLQNLAAPALYTRLSVSPDSNYILVDSVRRPFSYVVPHTRFPARTEVLDRSGARVRLVADLPLAEGIAVGGVRQGPRQVAWRADAPATLSWVQALDRGEAASQSPKRDGWYTLAAPFTASPIEQQRFEFRLQSVTWGDDSLALATEYWHRTRTTRSWIVSPGEPGKEPRLLIERSSQDRYKDPGRPVLTRNALGRLVIQRSADKQKIYLEGAGASPEGDRPFIDELDLATKQARRLWRSAPPHYDEFVAFLDPERTQMLLRRESATTPANYVVRNLTSDAEPRAITQFPNPFPQFSGMTMEVIRYKRADGVALTGKLYLPPGYTLEQGPLPTLLWAYPREYLSEETASQVNATPERFTRISPTGALPFVLSGFAVLDDPTMPIIGRNGKQPNDTYVEQLVSSAQAAIDELVRRGVTDPKRVAVGGHSYGAFMTANLLAHSRLFRAGIARSGAYNRTLTPFGFQAEPRYLWQAPAVYAAMSPFNYADKIKDPILLIHGEADNNSGTFPIQSERFYAALKGHGATARYVVLPHESHGYRARESLLHTLWETETWLNTHVKTSPPAPAAAKTSGKKQKKS
jgi:dipeptidyl aminopeptidase/acylaminoacyl peptidase